MSTAIGKAWLKPWDFTRRARLVAGRARVVAPPTAPDLAPAGESRRAQTMRSRHQEWETASVLPVLLGWLVFYAMAIAGALTGTQPSPVTAEMTAAIDGAPESRAR